MEIKRYAAIDIGSNAVRLLTQDIVEADGAPPQFKKTSLVRVPIRLGTDAFTKGAISSRNMERMEETMRAFKLLMDCHGIDDYKACATSAMREAGNGKALVKRIRDKTGIAIEIIDGNHEAAMIAMTDLHELVRADKTYLYVDVGGGSTEFTVFSKGRPVISKSFDLGTVRLLDNKVRPAIWQDIGAWIKTHTAAYPTVKMIGSGGNINHIFKHSGQKRGRPLKFLYLSSYYQFLVSLTYEERVSRLEMKLDRADVIVPAVKIYLSAMKWSGSQEIYVPKIGLSDGIIKALYNENNEERAD